MFVKRVVQATATPVSKSKMHMHSVVSISSSHARNVFSCKSSILRREASSIAQAAAAHEPGSDERAAKTLKPRTRQRRRHRLSPLTWSNMKPEFHETGAIRPPRQFIDRSQPPIKHRGFQEGYASRKHEFEDIRQLVQELPSPWDKIDFLNTHERDWATNERKRHAHYMHPLVRPRGAWHVPLAAKAYNSLPYYEYLTKTRVQYDDSLKRSAQKYNSDPSAADAELLNVLREFIVADTHMQQTERVPDHDTPMYDTAARHEDIDLLASAIVDHIISAHASSMSHLNNAAITRAGSLEAFWVRGGFRSLYYHKPVDKRLYQVDWIDGDHRCKYGELACRFADKPAVMLRTATPMQPIIDPDECYYPIDTNQIYHPSIMQMSVDSQELNMLPGYEVGTAEPCEFVHTQIIDMSPILDVVDEWNVRQESDESVIDEHVTAAGMISGFAACVAEAYALGFNQYNDLTYPLTSHTILTTGRDWHFVTYQLNTLNLAHDFPEIEYIDKITTPSQRKAETMNHNEVETLSTKRNVCWFDGPHELYKRSSDGSLMVHWNVDVARKILEMFHRPVVTEDSDAVLRPYLQSRVSLNDRFKFDDPRWGKGWQPWIGAFKPNFHKMKTNPELVYGEKRYK